MEFTELGLSQRKRTLTDNCNTFRGTAAKYRRTFESHFLSIKNPDIFLDFNQHYEIIQFHSVIQTDQYRPGISYRLLHYPRQSFMEIILMVSDSQFLQDLQLVLNCGSMMYRGCIDIMLNECNIVMNYTGLPCDMAFHEHTFNLPCQLCKEGKNTIKIQLSEGSPGVCWLSDAKISGVFTHRLP